MNVFSLRNMFHRNINPQMNVYHRFVSSFIWKVALYFIIKLHYPVTLRDANIIDYMIRVTQREIIYLFWSIYIASVYWDPEGKV